MAKYEAPLRDMRFVLHEVLGVEEGFRVLPGQDETSAELIMRCSRKRPSSAKRCCIR